MSKRNVSYVKPNEPAFLRRLKEQVGYKEGPNVDTKREKLAECSDGSDQEEESPQIVQLKPGDLSAEQVAIHKKELEEGRADLSRRVMFKRPARETEGSAPPAGAARSAASKKRKQQHPRSIGSLSFAAEEEEQ